MSTTKVSELTELSTAADNDVLLITDTSDNASKKITKANLIPALLDEDNMASDSATQAPTQQSVKAYVDSQVASKDALSELSGTSDDITEGSTNLFFTSAEQTKLSGIETNADVTDATNVDAAGAVMNIDTTTASMSFVVDEDTMTSNSATKVPTQQSVKAYVDNAVSAGIHYHTAVRVESPSNLNATYDNGTAGVGATLTNAGTNAAISIDGVSLSSADRVLIYNQTNAAHNGVYTVTTVGDGSTAWVLTRATDADSYGTADSNALGEGDAFFVSEGNTGAGELYVMNASGTITFGTTDITFTVIAETAVYSGGTGIDISGTVISFNGSTDLVSDTTPQLGGDLDTNGNDINFGDNDKAQFGAGNDLQIYHDGSASRVVDAGQGNLKIQGSNLQLVNSNDTGTYLYAVDGSYTKLYYNNSEKLATTSTGVDVTGTVTAAQLNLDTNSPTIRFDDDTTNNGRITINNSVMKIEADPDNSTASSAITFTVDGSEEMRLESDGDLHVDGDVIAYSTTISDRNLKKNIKPIEDALNKVNKLNGCTFTYTSDNVESAGLIAQEVEEVLPSAVRTKELIFHGEEGKEYKTLQYDQTIGLLVEAIKELTAKVEELENK